MIPNFSNMGLHVIQFPSGKFGFVGTVPAVLSYVTKDGGMPTEDQLRGAAQVGPAMVGLRTRVFATRQDALFAAKAIGAVVL